MENIIETNYQKVIPYIKKSYVRRIEKNRRSLAIKDTLVQALKNTLITDDEHYPDVLKEDYKLFIKSHTKYGIHKKYNNYFDFTLSKYDIPLSFQCDMLIKNLFVRKKWRIYMIWDCYQSLFCIGSRFPILESDLPKYINEIIRILLKYPCCINYNNGVTIHTNPHYSTYEGKEIYKKYFELFKAYNIQV